MDGIRLLSRCVSALAAAAMSTALAGPAVASPLPAVAPQPGHQSVASVARDDPPDVRGLSVDDARKVLQAWNRTVVIQVVPARLPAGVDESTVVVATSTLISQPTSPNVAAKEPVVRLTLGTRVPDLTGMTPTEATRALEERGLRLAAPTPQTEPTWVVTTQQVPPGSIVEFGLPVAATFAAPETSRPTIVLVSAAGLALLLLLLATALVIRASRRRTRRRRERLAAGVRLETHPGQVVGPDLTEQTGAVSVRLEPHHDRGTLRTEEVHR